MLCTNCGKTIPFVGNVCPWCHADKSGDQRMLIWGMIGGILGAFIGYTCGDIIGGVVGLFVGMIVMVACNFRTKPARTWQSTGRYTNRPQRSAASDPALAALIGQSQGENEATSGQEDIQDAQANVIAVAKKSVQQGTNASAPQVPPKESSPQSEDGEGEYEIVGVDKESKYDTTCQVHALSRANAKVKAELDGIIVTSIRRVMPSGGKTGESKP